MNHSLARLRSMFHEQVNLNLAIISLQTYIIILFILNSLLQNQFFSCNFMQNINLLKMKQKTLIILAFVTLFSLNSYSQINKGDTAPSFVANDQNGTLWKSDDYYGKKYLVVYFYPAAMTSGCTKQACSYRDTEKELKDLDVEVVGVSGDDVESLKTFEKEHQLNFTLLSDVQGVIAGKFGVPTSNGGSIYKETSSGKVELTRGITAKRWTFVIDKNRKVVYIDKGVNPDEDSKNVLNFIKSLK